MFPFLEISVKYVFGLTGCHMKKPKVNMLFNFLIIYSECIVIYYEYLPLFSMYHSIYAYAFNANVLLYCMYRIFAYNNHPKCIILLSTYVNYHCA